MIAGFLMIVIDAPVYKRGWEGKPKGLKQVLWERGFIEEAFVDEYTINPKFGADGDVIPESEDYSLLFFMSTCLDFAGEKTALQNVGHQRGVQVFITPKFHCEIAGEGIEYSWAVAKGKYRRMPLALKKGTKVQFHQLVKDCVTQDVLTTERVRKLSRRAKAYICAYYYLERNKEQDGSVKPASLPEIERLMNLFRIHRSALDFDRQFCTAQVRQAAEHERGTLAHRGAGGRWCHVLLASLLSAAVLFM
jgi:hypothetical protein